MFQTNKNIAHTTIRKLQPPLGTDNEQNAPITLITAYSLHIPFAVRKETMSLQMYVRTARPPTASTDSTEYVKQECMDLTPH